MIQMLKMLMAAAMIIFISNIIELCDAKWLDKMKEAEKDSSLTKK